MELSSNIHIGYTCTEEERAYRKRDAFLFDCLCNNFKSHMEKNGNE